MWVTLLVIELSMNTTTVLLLMNLVVLELCSLWKSRIKICFLYCMMDSLTKTKADIKRKLGSHHNWLHQTKPSSHSPSHNPLIGFSRDDSRGHVLDDAVEEVEALVVVGLGGNKLLEDSEQSGLKGQGVLPCYDPNTKSIKSKSIKVKNTRSLNVNQPRHEFNTRYELDLLFYRQQSWRWWERPSRGRPGAGEPEGGCSRLAPTARAAAGGGTAPCRRRGWSPSGSPGGGTSPGTRTGQTLRERGQKRQFMRH